MFVLWRFYCIFYFSPVSLIYNLIYIYKYERWKFRDKLIYIYKYIIIFFSLNYFFFYFYFLIWKYNKSIHNNCKWYLIEDPLGFQYILVYLICKLLIMNIWNVNALLPKRYNILLYFIAYQYILFYVIYII